MEQPYNYLYDFLNYNRDPDDKEFLWKACNPTNIEIQDNDVIITIPFQKQKCTATRFHPR